MNFVVGSYSVQTATSYVALNTPKERSEEYLSAVDFIQYTQVFFVSHFVWVRFILKRFHIIIKVKFSSFFY